MRQSKINFIFILFGIVIGFIMVNEMSCTHDDQVLDEYIPTPGTNYSETELLAKHVTTAPTLDGEIDLAWDDAQKLVGVAKVPDPGDNVFKGYVGDAYNFTMRSLYDEENIYFLLEWSDNSMNFNRETWYFDPATKRWKQENRYPTFNSNGVKTREAFYEDKLAVLWNVNNSVPDWANGTCYKSCHAGLGAANGYVRHYTNAPGERIDMWHWKSVRLGAFYGQLDDSYQDETQPNGRKTDAKISGGYTDNIQELPLGGTGTMVKVPKYFIPGRDYYFWVTKAEIDGKIAALITAVDENGVLTYDGGTIDPNADIAFQRDGSTVGAKGIPSVYIEEWVGSRGDVLVAPKYTGSGWVMEIQRKLKTDDAENQDVDFSTLEDQPFGIGIMDNAAIAHAIKVNLTLKFDKE